MAAFRPLRSFSAYPNPAPGALMATLKAYFDDSKNPQLLTIGGYLSDVDSWGRFESAWKQVLDDFSVPYLHMKETWDRDGIYKHIKEKPDDEAIFFHRLAMAIKDHTKFCTQTTVLLDDLKRFNVDHGLDLSAPALGVYGCLMALQWQFPRGEIEAIFDKFEQASSAIDLAKAYLRSDVSAQPLPGDAVSPFLSIYSFEKKDSWRNILPMQAADWLSWEMRKTCVDTKPWIAKKGHNPSLEYVRDFHIWAQRFYEKNGRQFHNRRSFIALREVNKPNGIILNYEQLGLIKDRHPHGWDLQSTSSGIQLFTST